MVRVRLLHKGWYMGQVIKRHEQFKAIKVGVVVQEMDKFLTMYFQKTKYAWVTDPQRKTKEGDMLIIKPLSSRREHPRITHEVFSIPFPAGHIIDPVSGKRCRGSEYLDDPESRTFEEMTVKP